MEAGEPNVVESSGSGSTGKFRRICVFCGSRSGNRPSFSQAALDLGKQLVERKIDLVYGGGSAGLMGLVSKTVFDGGCHVLGVVPTALLPNEVSGETIGDLIKVADMHERKSEMAKCADAFIALPGGYGTMEELLEIIAHSQLGIHHKPVGLLNVDGYYDSLLALFDKGVEQGFIEDSARHIVASAESAEELLRKMEITCRPSVGPVASWPPHVSVPLLRKSRRDDDADSAAFRQAAEPPPSDRDTGGLSCAANPDSHTTHVSPATPRRRPLAGGGATRGVEWLPRRRPPARSLTPT
ncbi:unnamed protein product [Musa acuminata subsp. malaccensis]|uniref:Cytokinin riboside 5'-monophosphate phosphoribohydrolase n=1 Tax=Musa acuminata subsp. malaccensis TaxID=214687 RepID=A0A804IKP5_MUSAM|nr:unnamed protein product [Musa acuminata subsp. malaccensis]